MIETVKMVTRVDALFLMDREARGAAEGRVGPGRGLHSEHVAETAVVFRLREVDLSNNLAENSMPPIALGRKNWLHVGSA